MFLTFIAVPLIFLGGCLVAVGVMDTIGSGAIAAGHASSEIRTPARRGQARGKKRLVRLGVKLLAIGAVLALVGSL